MRHSHAQRDVLAVGLNCHGENRRPDDGGLDLGESRHEGTNALGRAGKKCAHGAEDGDVDHMRQT